MTRYWWVNHKQTAKQEIAGGYLWSPKTEANGARSQFYDNMCSATPGDYVFSYANGEIRSVGLVSDYAVSAPKPDEFGETGKYWSAIGWLLPVSWQALAQPVRPKTILAELRPLLPTKYSPINPSSGDGNQKAYLTEISIELYELVAGQAGNAGLDPELGSSHAPSTSRFIDDLESAIQKSIEDDMSLSDTEKDQVVKARKGQGNFRDKLFQIERVAG